MAGDGRFPGSRVVAGTTFPGRNPVVFDAGFPLTVAGAAPASLGFRELPLITRARYSLLVQSEDQTPSARDSFRRKRPQVNPRGKPLVACTDLI
jgi:hypothetical protein